VNTYLRIEKRSRRGPNPLASRPCEGDHKMHKGANHILWMLGRPVWLCKTCADKWQKTYESALGDDDS
jgi:hypothetical protein